MKAQAEADGDIFLPNPAPSGPVDYTFVCMEPSLGRWAPTPEAASKRIAEGFRNFIYSLDDCILHYCASEYLCGEGQRYFVTDVSKGAMLVNRAGKERAERYNRWHHLLTDELDLLLRPSGRVIAVGSAVANHFQDHCLRDFSTIMHYSRLAAAGRNAAIVGREDEFRAYRESVALQDVVDNAEHYMLACGIPTTIRAETLARLSAGTLTDSRRKLMFVYKTAIRTDKKPFSWDGRVSDCQFPLHPFHHACFLPARGIFRLYLRVASQISYPHSHGLGIDKRTGHWRVSNPPRNGPIRLKVAY